MLKYCSTKFPGNSTAPVEALLFAQGLTPSESKQKKFGINHNGLFLPVPFNIFDKKKWSVV